MGRAPCCDKANVKRGPWSPEEDATLKRYIETHGIGGNWIALPQKAEPRSGLLLDEERPRSMVASSPPPCRYSKDLETWVFGHSAG
ncbi:hypothetical protein SLEP1_g36188 [Rubroshorea leprosula]|uniref:Myb-like domain-containing protein n=1 Tax=Rubroshorea leprosula TaxID=152421 RepID=A0AAV5KQS3_9ROSI|nr:hypothetical protein SLEP1_g36188 [Rubroshorea leprosula]